MAAAGPASALLTESSLRSGVTAGLSGTAATGTAGALVAAVSPMLAHVTDLTRCVIDPVGMPPDFRAVAFDRLGTRREVPGQETSAALWDDPALYHAVASRAQEIAHARYSEQVSRRKHLDYFTSLTPGARPIADPETLGHG